MRLLLILFASVLCISAQDVDVHITVKDPAGRSITDAVVTAKHGAEEPRRCEPDDDIYLCKIKSDAPVEFQVTASGFKPLRMRYAAGELTCCEYVFVLQLTDVSENVVTVTRSGSAIDGTPESVAILDRSVIVTSAAPTLDDTLRQIPGFSIFRRSSSRNANPTTQGVSLRGVGASGASRSAVMFEGVPLNDPFGGWVQWNRIPPIAVYEVEVLRGGASSLYGGSGLSGAIELRPRTASDELAFSAEAFGGSQRTASAAAFVGKAWNRWEVDAAGGHFQTRGFIPVDEN